MSGYQASIFEITHKGKRITASEFRKLIKDIALAITENSSFIAKTIFPVPSPQQHRKILDQIEENEEKIDALMEPFEFNRVCTTIPDLHSTLIDRDTLEDILVEGKVNKFVALRNSKNTGIAWSGFGSYRFVEAKLNGDTELYPYIAFVGFPATPESKVLEAKEWSLAKKEGKEFKRVASSMPELVGVNLNKEHNDAITSKGFYDGPDITPVEGKAELAPPRAVFVKLPSTCSPKYSDMVIILFEKPTSSTKKVAEVAFSSKPATAVSSVKDVKPAETVDDLSKQICEIVKNAKLSVSGC